MTILPMNTFMGEPSKDINVMGGVRRPCPFGIGFATKDNRNITNLDSVFAIHEIYCRWSVLRSIRSMM